MAHLHKEAAMVSTPLYTLAPPNYSRDQQTLLTNMPCRVHSVEATINEPDSYSGMLRAAGSHSSCCHYA